MAESIEAATGVFYMGSIRTISKQNSTHYKSDQAICRGLLMGKTTTYC
jgi:hypothetical protein